MVEPNFKGESKNKDLEYNANINDVAVSVSGILELSTLRGLEEQEKKSFLLRFNRSVESIIRGKAQPIEARKSFTTERQKYYDSLMLALYLELATTQSDQSAKILDEMKIPHVKKDQAAGRDYWLQVGQISKFCNELRQGKFVDTIRTLIEKRILRQTNFSCGFEDKLFPIVLPKDLPLQNMVLVFIQTETGTMKNILNFSEAWRTQCVLLKKLARKTQHMLDSEEISMFGEAKEILNASMQKIVLYVMKSDVSSQHADELAWLSFVEEPNDENFQKWRTQYLLKYAESRKK